QVENAKSVEQITTPPAFNGFSIVSGPNQQNSTTVINGAVSNSLGIVFILKPSATGRFTIPGAKAIVDGRQLQSNSVMVHVTNGPAHNNPAPQQGFMPFGIQPMPEEEPEVSEDYILRPGDRISEKVKNNLLVKLDVSKTSCYLGEPVIATYKLCSRLKSESRVTKRPSLDGFSVYDMVQPETNTQSVEKINGKAFNVHIIRKVQLYPLQDGSFVLDPTELDNEVHFIRVDGSGNGRNSPLDDYMNGYGGGKLEEQHVSLATKPVTITVKPLPAGKPASFDGAVGKFTLRASLDKPTVGANEIARLQLVLEGEGNLPLINAPQVSWPQGVDLYDPGVKEDDDKTVSPIRGTKEFDYSFSVKQPGRFIIPPVEFSYFDPKTDSYKTLHTDSMVLEVTKGTTTHMAAVVGDTAGKTAAASPAGNKFDSSKLFWILPVALGLMAFLLLLLRRKSGQKEAVKTPAPAAVPETPVRVDPFAGARLALHEGNSQLFYKETGKAIWNTLADQLQLGSSQLNKPVVTRLLQQKGVAPAVIAQLESVLLEAEIAMYTPDHSQMDMKAMLAKAESFVAAVEI
ncbi:MAG TPA: BatD family protein, partial [Chitinophagaceae bacterium]|nr:BatD family protein [Chitinophagaceae bacterium]